jgi:hypothetical protein
MGSKNQPGAFDCYANALPDEPMFVLLARDKCAPAAVEKWIELREGLIKIGMAPESDRAMLAEARQCLASMVAWREANDGRWRKPQVEGVDPTTTDLLKPRGNDGVVNAEICYLGLLLTSEAVTPEMVAQWTQEQLDVAYDWAMRVHLNASDNDDVPVPPRPAFLPRSSAEGRAA